MDPEDVIAQAQHKFLPLHRMTQYPFKIRGKHDGHVTQ